MDVDVLMRGLIWLDGQKDCKSLIKLSQILISNPKVYRISLLRIISLLSVYKTETMAKIIIIQDRIYSIWDVEIYLDEEWIGSSSSDENREFEVPVWQHKLNAKIGLLGSNDYKFGISYNETKTINITVNKILNYSVPIIITLVALYAILISGFKLKPFLSPSIPLFLLVIPAYFLTIGRNRSLSIK
jgi:hypothetical protein